MLRRTLLALPAAAALALAQQRAFPRGIRQGHVLAYDTRRRELLLFGGLSPAERSGAEPLWILGDEGWHRAREAGPRSRALAAAAYDSKRHRFVLYGGISGFAETRFGDLWEWDGSDWHELSFKRLGPGPRDHHAMAYDSDRGKMVMHGGSVVLLIDSVSGEIKTASETWFDETWEYDGEAWKPFAGTGPGTRAHHCLAHDPVRKVTMLIGGMSQDRSERPETWGWDATSWRKLAETGPAPRTHSRMAFHDPSGTMVLYGGDVATARGSQTMGDTWVWDGSTWSKRTPQDSPGPRLLHAMTYHADLKQVILYGGSPDARDSDDAWAWDGENWSRL